MPVRELGESKRTRTIAKTGTRLETLHPSPPKTPRCPIDLHLDEVSFDHVELHVALRNLSVVSVNAMWGEENQKGTVGDECFKCVM